MHGKVPKKGSPNHGHIVSYLHVPTHKKWLKIRYLNISEKGVCDDANAIHA